MKKYFAALLQVAIAGAFLGCAIGSHADPYPSKPIHIVVPYPPGGNANTSARILGTRLSEELGTPVLIENRAGAGAGGAVAMQYVAKAAPHGYTLAQSNPGPAAIAPFLYKNIGYTVKDFTPEAPARAQHRPHTQHAG